MAVDWSLETNILQTWYIKNPFIDSHLKPKTGVLSSTRSINSYLLFCQTFLNYMETLLTQANKHPNQKPDDLTSFFFEKFALPGIKYCMFMASSLRLSLLIHMDAIKNRTHEPKHMPTPTQAMIYDQANLNTVCD